MIEVTFDKKNGKLTGFTFDGHAGYAEYGKDIVCAGVSSLVLNTINSIECFCKDDKFTLDTKEDGGFIAFSLLKDPSKEASLLLNSLELGMKSIKESYKEHICLNYREV